MKKSILTLATILLLLFLTSCVMSGTGSGWNMSALLGGGQSGQATAEPSYVEESVYSEYDLSVEDVKKNIRKKLGKTEDIFKGIYKEQVVEKDGKTLKEHRYRDGETRFSLYILENSATKKVVSVRVEQPYGSDDKIFTLYQQLLIEGVTGINELNIIKEILASNDYVTLKAEGLGFGQETVHYGKSYFIYSSNADGRRSYEVAAVKVEEAKYKPTTFFDGKALHYFTDKDNYNRPRPYTEEDLVAILYDEFLNKEKPVSKEMLEAFDAEKQEDILALEEKYLSSTETEAKEPHEVEEPDVAPKTQEPSLGEEVAKKPDQTQEEPVAE